jgi:RimJ/RimL family protein N-acetyltransferase
MTNNLNQPIEVKPVTLEGSYIRLEPLTMDHHAGLSEAGLVEELWRWIPQPVRTPDDMREYIATALRWQEEGSALPFATVERATGKIIGSTRYGNIDRINRRVEIGWTWLGPAWQRTAANTEAKFLMLRHAFESLGCMRVELKTDSLNEKSRNAILRIGAKEEGIFRNHMVTSTGRIRHSVYYSIIDSEWLEVKACLQERLRQ